VVLSVPDKISELLAVSFLPEATMSPMYEYDQDDAVVPDNAMQVTVTVVPAANTTIAFDPELFTVTDPVELFCMYQD
jgi:hypothetical protein